MRVLGIDPGIAITGFGLIDYVKGQPKPVDYGCILTDKVDSPSVRLHQLHHHFTQLLNTTQPDIVVVEKLFFNTNTTTAMIVGQARGVVLLAIQEHGATLAEYTPLQVKMAVCGYGRAKKPQVQQMIQTILGLSSIPKPDDAADALAIALCHTQGARETVAG